MSTKTTCDICKQEAIRIRVWKNLQGTLLIKKACKSHWDMLGELR